MADALSADHLAAQDAGFEPQRESNWQIQFANLPGSDSEVIKLSLVSAALPIGTNEVIVLDYGNTSRKVAGGITYDNIPLVVRDFVDEDTRNALLRWRRQVYNAQTQGLGFASAYKVDATITIYGPDGTLPRECKLKGCWPSADPGGNLDHTSKGTEMKMELPLEYDEMYWTTI